MTNIKQRAQELLQDKGLMIPEEVRQFMRDVVALEPVGIVYDAVDDVHGDASMADVWMAQGSPRINLKKNVKIGEPVYTLGAPNDPA